MKKMLQELNEEIPDDMLKLFEPFIIYESSMDTDVSPAPSPVSPAPSPVSPAPSPAPSPVSPAPAPGLKKE